MSCAYGPGVTSLLGSAEFRQLEDPSVGDPKLAAKLHGGHFQHIPYFPSPLTADDSSRTQSHRKASSRVREDTICLSASVSLARSSAGIFCMSDSGREAAAKAPADVPTELPGRRVSLSPAGPSGLRHFSGPLHNQRWRRDGLSPRITQHKGHDGTSCPAWGQREGGVLPPWPPTGLLHVPGKAHTPHRGEKAGGGRHVGGQSRAAAPGSHVSAQRCTPPPETPGEAPPSAAEAATSTRRFRERRLFAFGQLPESHLFLSGSINTAAETAPGDFIHFEITDEKAGRSRVCSVVSVKWPPVTRRHKPARVFFPLLPWCKDTFGWNRAGVALPPGGSQGRGRPVERKEASESRSLCSAL
ncbi:hypothetical protein GN956_G9020 [Arapaima gigas]